MKPCEHDSLCLLQSLGSFLPTNICRLNMWFCRLSLLLICLRQTHAVNDWLLNCFSGCLMIAGIDESSEKIQLATLVVFKFNGFCLSGHSSLLTLPSPRHGNTPGGLTVQLPPSSFPSSLPSKRLPRSLLKHHFKVIFEIKLLLECWFLY